jgi:hypothetical protein
MYAYTRELGGKYPWPAPATILLECVLARHGVSGRSAYLKGFRCIGENVVSVAY